MFRAERLSAGLALVVTGVASASFSTGLTMYQSPGVATYASPVGGGTLDIDNPTPYVWPYDTGAGFHNSGYLRETVDSNGDVIPPGVIDRTTLVSQVYQVTTPTVIPNGAGDLALSVGDMVFTYTIRLTSQSTNTVDTLAEFGVTALGTAYGEDGAFTPDQVLGRGLSVAGLGVPTGNFPVDQPGDFTYDDLGMDVTFGISSIDWEWPVDPASQLDNTQEITLMIFTKPSLIGNGYAKFVGNPGTSSSTADPIANNVPVLVPIIPAPGSAGLLLAAGLVGIRPRRHQHRLR